MLADQAHSDRARLANVFADLVEFALTLGSGLHHNVAGIHAKAFDRHPHAVAGVAHSLQNIEVERARLRTFGRNKVSPTLLLHLWAARSRQLISTGSGLMCVTP